MPVRLHTTFRLLPAFLAALAVLALPAIAGANADLKVGFLDNTYAEHSPDAFWADAATLNVGVMRWDLQWATIAPSQPVSERDPADPAYRWAATDAFVIGAANHGLQDRVMFTLWKTPPWAASVKNKGALETQMPTLTAWKNFVAAAATRYSGQYVPLGASEPLPRVIAWETWNEPNAKFAFRPQYKGGKAVSPKNYVILLNALKQEVNAAAPFTPTFVAGAMFKQGSPRSNPGPIEFMRGLKAAGAKFDVLSMHPYNNTPNLGLNDGLGLSTTNPSFVGVGNFNVFISLANQIFHKKYPIWVTEFGWATPAAGKSQYTTSFANQAKFAAKSIARFRSLPQVERAIWFLIRDDISPDDPSSKAWYSTGLKKSDDVNKPSFNAWANATKSLSK